MFNRTGLVPPYSGNGAGNAKELTTADEIRQQIELPIRDARTGALKDAVTYLTDNALNGAGHNVRQAINIRHNLPWIEVDSIIRQAEPLAEREIEKAKAERIRTHQEQARFESLSALFNALGLQIQTSGDKYSLAGLTESQLRVCAVVLTEGTP